QGFNIRGERFSDWLRAERERLHRGALQVLSKLLAVYAERSDIGASLATAHRLLSLDPLDEGACRTLMRLYVADRRRDLALQQYATFRSHLQRELGVGPEPETEATAPGYPGSAACRARATGWKIGSTIDESS